MKDEFYIFNNKYGNILIKVQFPEGFPIKKIEKLLDNGKFWDRLKCPICYRYWTDCKHTYYNIIERCGGCPNCKKSVEYCKCSLQQIFTAYHKHLEKIRKK